MNNPIYSRISYMILMLVIISSCHSSQQIMYGQNESGVYQAQKSSIPKGAVRLTIELKTNMQQGDGEYFAEAMVVEVHSYGGTFASIKPRRGETVKLSIVDDIEGRSFKKGDRVLLDALTPIQKMGELLDISML